MSELQFLRTLARYDRDIKEGRIHFDYRTGQCGPVQATDVKSWGAACPPGNCSAADLPAALNRYFAGDRSGCRELPYTIRLSATAAVTDTAAQARGTSLVTMCPTRIIAIPSAGSEWLINGIKFGNTNEIVGGPVPAVSLDPAAFQSVPLVPDCLRAGQPYQIDATLVGSAGEGTKLLSLIFIGPTVG